jgi:predicted DNA-binding transcriptional regulator AlpA
MTISFVKKAAAAPQPESVAPIKEVRGKQPPPIDIDRPGRLRVSDVTRLLRISRATLYNRVNSGIYPKPEKDGYMTFWRSEAIRPFV